MDADYERVILVKPEVFMYKIPPRVSNRAYRAADWNLEAPDWNGRMRILSVGAKCVIKLEDKNSGELFAACPVDSYPTTAVENVSDSARYFVLRIKDESGRSAFIGMGFVDRSDSFDFNVALQDHFKYLKKDEELAKAPPLDNEKKLDLSFKEGQTIKINIGKKTETSMATSRPRAQMSGGPILLPPPPSTKMTGSNQAAGIKPPPQPQQQQPPSLSAFQSVESNYQKTSQQQQSSHQTNNTNSLLLDFDPAPFNVNNNSGSTNPTNANNSSNTASLLDLDFFQK